MAKDSKNWESPLEKTLKQQQELARRIMDGRLLDDFKDLQEKINKPYKDIQTTIRKINQPYKDLQVGLTKSPGNVAMGQLGLAALSHTQNLIINTAMGKISKQNSLQALTESARGSNIALTQWERSFAVDVSSRFSTGSASQRIAESLERSDIEFRKSIDKIINGPLTNSLPSAISSAIGLQPLAGQQALNMLNVTGSIGSVAASIASENRSLADLLPRFSAGSAFQKIAESRERSSIERMRSIDRMVNRSFGSASQRIAESLERSDIEFRKSIDKIINGPLTNSLPSAISSAIGLQPLAGQQALNMLNVTGSIGSVAASIASENRSLADLLPRFSAGSAFREVAESLRKSDVKLRRSVDRVLSLIEVIPKLANLGWFLARKILQDIPTDLLEIIRSTDPANIANIMGKYFRKKLDRIADEIIINYPERQCLLGKIFQTHRQGEYDISILLSLTQADGISKRRFGGEVFMKRGRRIIASYSLSFHAEDLISNESLPIWASESNRPNNSFILNRHQIVHGESTDYGNELNSLKAISFLYWIHCLE